MTTETFEQSDSFGFFVLEELGPLALTGGTTSIYDAAQKAWNAGRENLRSELAKQAGSVEAIGYYMTDAEIAKTDGRSHVLFYGRCPGEQFYPATALAAQQAKIAELTEEVQRLNTEKAGDDQLWSVLVKQAEESCKHGRDVGESDFDLIQRVLKEADASRGALILTSSKLRQETERADHGWATARASDKAYQDAWKQLQSAQLDNKRLRDDFARLDKSAFAVASAGGMTEARLAVIALNTELQRSHQSLETQLDTSAADELLARVNIAVDCLSRINTAVASLPTFEIVKEGEEEAATENIVLAINAAGSQLAANQARVKELDDLVHWWKERSDSFETGLIEDEEKLTSAHKALELSAETNVKLGSTLTAAHKALEEAQERLVRICEANRFNLARGNTRAPRSICRPRSFGGWPSQSSQKS